MKIASTQACQYRNTIYSRTYGNDRCQRNPADEFLTFSTSRTTTEAKHTTPAVNHYDADGGYLSVNPNHDLITPERHLYKPNFDESGRSGDEIRYEAATMNLVSEGEVITEDGRKIDFFYTMSLTRESHIIEQASTQKGSDSQSNPLVINLNGKAPRFSGATMKFDLDADGELDEMSLLAQGSGFLALDLNNDGIINDGSELFGASGTFGFEELRKYDSDNNMWLDENDEIFDRLTILEIDDQGKMRQTALKESGVGAIYLDSEQNDFALWDASSVGLNEDGSVCSVHAMNMSAGFGNTPFIDQVLPGADEASPREETDTKAWIRQNSTGFLKYFKASCLRSSTKTNAVFHSTELKKQLSTTVEKHIAESVHLRMNLQAVEIVFDTTHFLSAFDELWGENMA